MSTVDLIISSNKYERNYCYIILGSKILRLYYGDVDYINSVLLIEADPQELKNAVESDHRSWIIYSSIQG